MQRVFIILGMQRSGTSCLAGILEKSGVDFGKVSNYNLFNKRGNKENAKIIVLHDNLLKINNGSWDNPPLQINWSNYLNRKRRRIIHKYRNYSVWGFKDPRTLLALEAWLKDIPNAQLIATFRHPSLVAQSLQDRDSISFYKGISLWKIYNEKLIYYHRMYKFPIVNYDLPKNIYYKNISKSLNLLNIKSNVNALDFYDENLKHFKEMTDQNIPNDIMDIYEKLTAISILK